MEDQKLYGNIFNPHLAYCENDGQITIEHVKTGQTLIITDDQLDAILSYAVAEGLVADI